MRLGSIAVICVSFCVQTFAQQSAPTAKPDRFDPTSIDRSVSPCDDFYKFACGKWLAANPVPPDQVWWGHDGALELWNQTILREVLEQASANDAKRSPVQQKIGDYYFACMDEKGIAAAGAKPLKPELERIAAIKKKSDLAQEVAHLHMTVPGAWELSDAQTRAPMFGLTGAQDFDNASRVVAFVDQGGMSMPGREFYLNDDAKSVEIRKKFQEHVSKMFALAGENAKQAADDAATVLAMETEMAKAAMDIVKRRDPANLNHKMSLAQIAELAPSFDWKGYLSRVNAPTPEHYIVTSPDYFRGLEKMLQEHPLEHWKTYLRWWMLHGSARYLSTDFEKEDFDFFRHTLAGAEALQPRWRRCVDFVDRDLGEALGQAYVDRAFPPASKQRTLEMVHAIEGALSGDIQRVDWMSPQTKQQAEVKLKGIEDKIGYPNRWRDYSSVKVGRASFLENVHQATDFEFHRWLNKIGKPVDRGEWTMTPPTINAYYDPQLNTINFPAGILQPPYFDANMDDAVNFGGAGAVIGHEITHGFDDQGRKFDAQGNLRDWWTPTDAKEYDQRGKCISDQYTQEIPEAGVKQNGLLTQGEDTADNGGTRLALMALAGELAKRGQSLDDKGADGWSNRQRFFLSYATSWCSNIRSEILRTVVLSNPHSAPKYRVNNVVSDIPEFSQAFSCKQGQPMARENACRVW